jgi:hypothetical protein
LHLVLIVALANTATAAHAQHVLLGLNRLATRDLASHVSCLARVRTVRMAWRASTVLRAKSLMQRGLAVWSASSWR